MAYSPFDMKSRINGGAPLKATPTNSPQSRQRFRSPQRQTTQEISLSIRRVIGTTTASSNGLTSHYDSNRFAYCAGSAAVLAQVDDQGGLHFRYFRAHPMVSAVNPSTSFYNHTTTPTGTPESRRRAVAAVRQGVDEKAIISSPRRNWVEEGSSRAWSARERVKAASCVHLSKNGRFLAVGETGYNPRVNIFSLVGSTSENIPLTILTEHAFGVRSVSFSPDSRWLATLGDVTDGFLFIWSVSAKTGAARLRFTNKCTASVLDMAWCGNNLITVGTRHVKIWRLDDPPTNTVPQGRSGRPVLETDGSPTPAPKTLSGRNCRLGSLMDSTFTCVQPISESEAILCATSGAMCLLDDHTGNQRLKLLKHTGFPTQSAAVDLQSQRILFASDAEQFESESFENLRSLPEIPRANGVSETSVKPTKSSWPFSPRAGESYDEDPASPRSAAREYRRSDVAVKASACLPSRVVTVDQEHTIHVKCLAPEEGAEMSKQGTIITLPSHKGTIQGVIPLPITHALGQYVTWSSEGTISFWSLDGSLKRRESIELEQPEQTYEDECANELRLVRISRDGEWLVAGDRLGVLQIIQCHSWSANKMRAHSAEMTDVAVMVTEDSLLVTTSSRDRTVQLLQQRKGQTELLQTFDDHTSAVNAVAFVVDCLVSASSDRTVIVRQRLSIANADNTASPVYITRKVIVLKASPTSLAFPRADEVVISTMDKQVSTFNMLTGVLLDSFKAFDAEGEDAVVLTSLNVDSIKTSSGVRNILVAFSTTDKSIRVYDFDRGVLLVRELSHTEGISAIAMLENPDDSLEQEKRTIISTGLDGLSIVWDLFATQLCAPSTPQHGVLQDRALSGQDSVDTRNRDSILKRPPQRKVMTKLSFNDASGCEVQSPPRPRRKTSKQALVSRGLQGCRALRFNDGISLDEADPIAQPSQERLVCTSPTTVKNQICSIHHSSCTWPVADTADAVTKSQQDLEQSHEAGPSPSSRPVLLSLSAAPKAPMWANRGPLRKVSSIPSEMREKVYSTTRRRSLGAIDDSSSMGRDSDQICRLLRAYRKGIESLPAEKRVQLNTVEIELLATLQAVGQRYNKDTIKQDKGSKGG